MQLPVCAHKLGGIASLDDLLHSREGDAHAGDVHRRAVVKGILDKERVQRVADADGIGDVAGGGVEGQYGIA
jgi:hypothetical protein